MTSEDITPPGAPPSAPTAAGTQSRACAGCRPDEVRIRMFALHRAIEHYAGDGSNFAASPNLISQTAEQFADFLAPELTASRPVVGNLVDSGVSYDLISALLLLNVGRVDMEDVAASRWWSAERDRVVGALAKAFDIDPGA